MQKVKGNNIKKGMLVEVRPFSEIVKTLDSNGTLDGLPFMPEMTEYCGRKFSVSYKIEKTCVGKTGRMSVNEFINNDVFFLEGIRCNGANHDNCQRGCMIFWKGAWLKKAADDKVDYNENKINEEVDKRLLKTKVDDNIFFCQSTELDAATLRLTKVEKLLKVFSEVKSGTYGIIKGMKLVILPVWRKIIRKIKNQQPYGRLSKTKTEILNLQPGETVVIKSIKEIIETLDKHGKNKGLEFSPDMRAYCGKKFKVKNRLDKMILEHNGKMININNTVILDEITCNCFYALGGCTRRELQFWREIWLTRVED